MIAELRDLYQELIIDHSKKPRNFRVSENARHQVKGYNPLCGDRYTIYFDLDEGVIKDISFDGAGCAISKASASMMTASVKGRTTAEVSKLFKAFQKMILGRPGDSVDEKTLGKLSVFSGVCEFPIRVKCASLPWHALKSGIAGDRETVSTE